MSTETEDLERAILMRIAFKGAQFHGYQIQDNADTVQAQLTRALSAVLNHPVTLRSSSRTDAGVHALDLPVAFTTSCRISLRGIVLGANSHLPTEIRVMEAQELKDFIEPRRSHKGKIYRYHFWNAPIVSPMLADFTCLVPKALDLSLADQALDELCGKHDFSAFRARGCTAAHAMRRITKATLKRSTMAPSLITLEIHGEAFVRHQIRIIAGTILEICLGMRDPASMKALLKPAKRDDAGKTAPAHGLILLKVHMEPQGVIGRWPREPVDSTSLFPVLCE